MDAFIFIQNRRKSRERIDFVGQLRTAQHADKRAYERQLEQWARDAELNLRFEE